MADFDETGFTAAGTDLRICAARPTTHDAAGFRAIFPPAPTAAAPSVGNVTDFGTIGREYKVVQMNPVFTRGTQKLKGSFDEGSTQIKIAIARKDAGQEMMREALNSDRAYCFAFVYPDGYVTYFLGKVTSWSVETGGVDSIVSATAKIELVTTRDGKGIVEATPVAAPVAAPAGGE